MWVTSSTVCVGWDWRKSSELSSCLRTRVEIQSWARPDEFVRYGRRVLVGLGANDVKAVSIERLCLSLLMSKKPLNSKRWIKVLYLNQFCVFGFLYVFMNILWTLCLFHISVSWVCYSYSFPWIAPLYPLHTLYWWVLSKEVSSTIF